MSDGGLNTPVVFIIFNRPSTTEQVFAQIALARPRKLLVVADGPQAGNATQAQRCAETRAIIDRVDWPCDTLLNYSEINLGCRRRVSSGLDWAFDQVPEAIILEDDCVPHPTFFRYCEDLLDRYRDDTRIGIVCGTNLQLDRRIGAGSYYFSKYPHIWGWAGWRRAWRYYDVNASAWPEFLASGSFERMTLPSERRYWRMAFEGVHAGRINTWDYQWVLAFWCHSMLSVIPQANLVSNIGFGPAATHTQSGSVYANLPTASMQWPMMEPNLMLASADADAFMANRVLSASIRDRIQHRLRRAGLL
jgi:hypothetical protein